MPDPPGRAALLAELAALVETGSPVVLRGPRRSGKTSVLHALARRFGDDSTVLHETLEGTRVGSPDELARLLDPSLAAAAAPAGELRQRLRGGPPTVVLLDELVHLLNAEPATFAWLRSLGQDGTSVVLAGTRADWAAVVDRAGQTGASFGNDVTPVDVGPLTEPAAVEFLVAAAAPTVALDADRTVRWIVDRCGTWPFYLQVTGFAVVRAVEAGDRRVLDDPDAVRELYERRLLVERDHVFRNRWDELPRHARAALLREPVVPPPVEPLTSQERRAFVLASLLTAPDLDGAWVEDRPMFDWVRRHRARLDADG